ncbi:MAG: hypothetical protein JST92_21620 [Deltaproteobacteria bacterium]|nr:hypothetical protein [Deltaproteobacteria bacterium]
MRNVGAFTVWLSAALILAMSARARAEDAPAAPAVTSTPGSTSTPASADPRADGDSAALSQLAHFVEIHGFASQGFIKTTGTNYLVQNSKRGSFEFNEIGFNLTKDLTDRLRVGMQIFARSVGSVGTYTPKFDWFYLDYHFQDWLGFRAGRTKLPFGLYNEVYDIDSARVPVLLPQSIYPLLNRDTLLAQTGLEAYGYVRIGPLGAIDYRLYGGTFYFPTPSAPGATLLQYDVPYIIGGRVMWETPLEGLRMGGSLQAARIDADYTVVGAGGAVIPVSLQFPYLIGVVSVEYIAHDLLLAAEWGRWRADIETNIAPATRTVNERAYALAQYRVLPWLTPAVYYSVFVPNIDHREGTEHHQYDLAATLRFDFNAHWLLKLEGHYLQGTGDVSRDLNDNRPLSSLANDWFMILAKTTVYF